jgi:tetratricopeptide (TPR) repeat protein
MLLGHFKPEPSYPVLCLQEAIGLFKHGYHNSHRLSYVDPEDLATEYYTAANAREDPNSGVIRVLRNLMNEMTTLLKNESDPMPKPAVEVLMGKARDLSVYMYKCPTLSNLGTPWSASSFKIIARLGSFLQDPSYDCREQMATNVVLVAKAFDKRYLSDSRDPGFLAVCENVKANLLSVIADKNNLQNMETLIKAYHTLGSLADKDWHYRASTWKELEVEEKMRIDARYLEAIEYYQSAVETARPTSNTELLQLSNIALLHLLVRGMQHGMKGNYGRVLDVVEDITQADIVNLTSIFRETFHFFEGLAHAIMGEWGASKSAYIKWENVLDRNDVSQEHELTRAKRYLKDSKDFSLASLSHAMAGDPGKAMLLLEKGRGRELRHRLALGRAGVAQVS